MRACLSFERDNKDEKRYRGLTNGSADAGLQRWRRNLHEDVANAYLRLMHPQEDGFALLQDGLDDLSLSGPVKHVSGRKKRKSIYERSAQNEQAVLVGARGSMANMPSVQDFFSVRPKGELAALLARCNDIGEVAEKVYAVKSGALPCGGAVHATEDFRGRPWHSSVTFRRGGEAEDSYGTVQLLAHVFTKSRGTEQIAIVRVMKPRPARCEYTDMLLLRWAGDRPPPTDFVRSPVRSSLSFPFISLPLSSASVSLAPRLSL